ncbi:S8 family serine peptidase [Enhygromyxa salina]|uniref:Subtilisin DY n=1 Tax=Enhygromyxa salina TaxID=215803 RepID=A0A2S9XU13_9BACT|nr:S8 family serine peptidase [Enhygromyxa salina]PRP96220.1 Subtilisin DY [Enhygromyxa salina]
MRWLPAAEPIDTTARTRARSLALALGLPLLLTPELADAQQPTRVWVFFADHGRSDTQLEIELKLRAAELGPRTLARRAKVRGDQLVDAWDLLPAAPYVAAVEQIGADTRVQSRWLNAVSIDADPQTQAEIAALPFVRGLYPVGRSAGHELVLELDAPPLAANPDDYGLAWEQLNLLGVPALHDCGLTGAGVVVGVQDLGFVLDHQAYATTQVLAAHDFVNDDDNVGIEGSDHPEQHVHGTVVLATITGMDPGSFRGAAPGVSVILAKTEHVDIEQPFEEDIYVEGLEWIEGMGADIFTASLNYIDWYTADELDGASAVTTVAVEAAVANGLIVFAPMGNTGPAPTTLGAPADAAGAITLGAVDLGGQLAGFSSRGPTADGRIKPDVLAPGHDVSTVDPGTLDTYTQVSGTSLSTPLAAGVGALLLEAYPWLTPADMAQLLRSTALGADAPDSDNGYGIIDAVAAAQLYCTCTDADADTFFDVACGGDDCVDANPAIHPGASEQCNGIDDDCDDLLGPDEIDADQDGFLICAGDCDDAAPGTHPDAAELCDNEVDDDCDTLIDAQDPDCAAPPGDGDGDGDGDPGGDGDGDPGGETGADTGATDETDAGQANGETPGCACTVKPSRAPGAFALLPLLLAFVRPRRRP